MKIKIVKIVKNIEFVRFFSMDYLNFLNNKNSYEREELEKNDLYSPFKKEILIKKEYDLISFFNTINLDYLFLIKEKLKISPSILFNIDKNLINDLFNKNKVADFYTNEEKDFLFLLIQKILINNKNLKKIDNFRVINSLLKDKNSIYLNKKIITIKNSFYKSFTYNLVITFLKRINSLIFKDDLTLNLLDLSSLKFENKIFIKNNEEKNSILNEFITFYKKEDIFYKNLSFLNISKIKNNYFKNFEDLKANNYNDSDNFIFENEDDYKDFLKFADSINLKVNYLRKMNNKTFYFLIFVLENILKKEKVDSILYLKEKSDNIDKFIKNYKGNNAFYFLSFLNETINLYQLYNDPDEHYFLNELFNYKKIKKMNLKEFYYFLEFILYFDFAKKIDEKSEINLFRLNEIHLLKKSNKVNKLILSSLKKSYKENVMYKSLIIKNFLLLKKIFTNSINLEIYHKSKLNDYSKLVYNLDSLEMIIKILNLL